MASDPISKPEPESPPKSKKLVSRRGKLSLVSEQQTPESRPEPEPEPDLLAQPAEPADGHVPPLSADLSADTLPPYTALALSTLVLEYDRLATRIADLKASQDELKSEIESICFEIPAKRISGLGWHTTRSKKPTTFIDKNKLAEKGVDPDVIAYATVKTWSKEFVLPVVERPKGEGKSK